METTNVKTFLQEAVTSLCKHKKYFEQGFQKAQRIGLQGEKRVFRLETVKHHNLVNYLISDAFDSFGVTLETPSSPAISPIEVPDIPTFFKNYLQVLEKEYVDLHTIANSLVIALAKYHAGLLYEKCDWLMKRIKYYRRTIMEGDLNDWSKEYMTLLLSHQTTAYNEHDGCEKEEAEFGYKY